MNRLIDLLLIIIFLPFVFIFLGIIYLIILLHFNGPVLHWSKRIGLDNKIFYMPKFRTMKINTPQLATHLLKDPSLYVTKFGSLLRKYSLDELPQIISIINSDMSFVGPRPALFNQYDLINERTKLGINKLKPGITGWAQINGRDELSIKEKVFFEKEYLERKSIFFDIKIILLTILKLLNTNKISH